jgi:hypothetical protein
MRNRHKKKPQTKTKFVIGILPIHPKIKGKDGAEKQVEAFAVTTTVMTVMPEGEVPVRKDTVHIAMKRKDAEKWIENNVGHGLVKLARRQGAELEVRI